VEEKLRDLYSVTNAGLALEAWIVVFGIPAQRPQPNRANALLELKASNHDGDIMRHKQVSDTPKTFVLIFDIGDEILTELKQFASEQKLADSSFKAIGGLSHTKVGWFNWETKKYEIAAELDEQVELLSLIGDIAVIDKKPQVHAHMVIGRRDGTAHGGHLMEAIVRPTCELVLTENPIHLHKHIDPKSGVALIRI
jgi:predicted DNA-binding protein with PD1-like motif